MGLGKTIQTISLLLDAKAKAKERVKAAAVANAASSAASTTASSAASTTASSAASTTASASSVDAAVGGSTLVVAPTSALIQWSEEIVKFAGDELSVLIYYDKRAGMTIDELKSHDVVLTTYQIAEHEWRSEDNLTKLPCIHCEKYFQPDKLKWHNMYQCGPDAQRTTKQMKTERKAGGSSSPATGARVPTDGVGDTIDFNLGGLPFLQGAAAPDPSLSSAAAAAAAKKRSPAATPAEDPAAAAAASKQKQKQKDDAPRTITDCYRKYMHEAGREPVKMYEAAHRARARQWDSNAAAAAAADGGGSSDDDDSTQSGEAAGAAAAADSSAPAPAAAADASQSLQSPNIKLEPGDKQQPQQRDEEPEMIDIDDCPEPWVCNSCTLNNSGYLDYCEVCGAQKVTSVVDSGAGASSSPPAAAAAAAAAAPIAGSSPALEIEIKDEVDVASGDDDAEPSSKAKAKPKQTKAKGAQGKSKTKAGAAKKRKAKKKKVEGSPKKGMSSYFHYTAASRPEFKSQHPDATVQELAKLMGAAWKQLTAEAKQPFESLAAKDKERYQNEKAAWDITHPEETPPPEATIKAEEDAEGGGGGAPANASNSGENENDENDDDDDDDDFEPVPKRMRAASEAAANGTSKGKGKAGKGKGGGAAKRKKALPSASQSAKASNAC
eukprot:COSAG06_NODE_1389_length_9613_cov_4.527643_3_plen_666_part_00